jgi:hypothetical protein
LRIGISKIILLLQDMPHGFSSTRPMRSVILDYVQDLRDLDTCPPDHMESFHACTMRIFSRHRDLILQLERGIVEFQSGVKSTYQPFAGFGPTRCQDVSDSVSGMRRIGEALDEFFKMRATLRLLIAHVLELNGEPILPARYSQPARHVPRTGSSPRVGEAVDMETHAANLPEVRRVGVVNLNTRPSLVLVEAFQHAQLWCRQKFNCSVPLLVNDVPALQYPASMPTEDQGTPYVDMHLYFIFFEVLKNAFQASLRHASGGGGLGGHSSDIPPVYATMVSGASPNEENECMVKISDSGPGVPRDHVNKVWSYFYSTKGGKERTSMCEPVYSSTTSDATERLPGGLGLGVSRVLTRYFGGEIKFHSIQRKGTDVYIYI